MLIHIWSKLMLLQLFTFGLVIIWLIIIVVTFCRGKNSTDL